MNDVAMRQPISTGSDWSFELLERYDEAIAKIAAEYGLDTYPNQIEVITSEQMLDAYALNGLPIGYPHWSYGKEFLRNEKAYRSGMQGLAYEIVINSNPCIAYLMEENSMALQALVIAHAAYGHNSFFKGNYLFRQWTHADGILDYMVFARNYVMQCEERYGVKAVEQVLDSCHALMEYGVDRYRHPSPLSAAEEKARQKQRLEDERLRYDDLIEHTLPTRPKEEGSEKKVRDQFPTEPEENILYFVEKHSPKLLQWQRELVRIVRKTAQYFYPQGQTKTMNEGWATFWHYTILNTMYQRGLVNDAFMLEFLHSHTSVVKQWGFDERGYRGMNPYALGFAMMRDIRRICEEPTDEDREWFPSIAGSDWVKTLDTAMRNFKDESFIAQYLSPKLIRDFRLFTIADHEDESDLIVDSIHNTEGYQRVRTMMAAQYNRDNMIPNIQVSRYDRHASRSLTLQHVLHRGRPLNEASKVVMLHLARLWGFPVVLDTIDEEGEKIDSNEFESTRFDFEEEDDGDE